MRSWRAVPRGVLLVGGLAAAAGAPAGAVEAQTVSGVLLGRVSPEPLAGVVITVARTRDGEVVGRAVTGAAGTFRLDVGTDSILVRALRIGQRPVTLYTGRLAAGERRDVGGVLPDEPVAIASVRVRERARCGAPAADGSVVSALFADALTALAASVSRMDGAAPVMRSLRVEEERDRRDRLQASSEPVVTEGAATQAFRSVPVPLLLAEGFVVREADGASTYRAPDAVVLTDDRFLARTCLSLDRSREAEGRVGIRFTPARRVESRVDVEGVLWLDAATRALERLDFSYLGLTSIAASVNPGGTVEYAQLPDGRWIIERWSLRMPRLETIMVAAPRGLGQYAQVSATGTTVVRGLVTLVRAGDRVLYTVGGPSGEAALRRALWGARGATFVDTAGASGGGASVVGTSTATPAALARCEARVGASSPRGLALVVRVTDADGASRAGVHVEAEWRDRQARAADGTWAWETERVTAPTADDGDAVLCDVSRTRPVEVRAIVDGCAPVRVPLRPVAEATRSDVTLRLPPGCRP